MRLTVAICCILNLQMSSYSAYAGYSDRVLNGPVPILEDFGNERGGSNQEKKRDFGDGSSGRHSTSSRNQYGELLNHRDIQERERALLQQRRSKLAATEGQVVFGRKKHGRYEFEDGERFEESGESGDGHERNWYFGKGEGAPRNPDGSRNRLPKNEDGEENERHHLNDYTHRRRKNFTKVQRSKKATGNKLKIGDLSRFRKIHRKHFGSGNDDDEIVEHSRRGPKRSQHQDERRKRKFGQEDDIRNEEESDEDL